MSVPLEYSPNHVTGGQVSQCRLTRLAECLTESGRWKMTESVVFLTLKSVLQTRISEIIGFTQKDPQGVVWSLWSHSKSLGIIWTKKYGLPQNPMKKVISVYCSFREWVRCMHVFLLNPESQKPSGNLNKNRVKKFLNTRGGEGTRVLGRGRNTEV